MDFLLIDDDETDTRRVLIVELNQFLRTICVPNTTLKLVDDDNPFVNVLFSFNDMKDARTVALKAVP